MENKMIKVSCMENNTDYYFAAGNSLDALKKMFYTLSLKFKMDGKFEDLLFYGRKTVYLCNGGKTYCTLQ